LVLSFWYQLTWIVLFILSLTVHSVKNLHVLFSLNNSDNLEQKPEEELFLLVDDDNDFVTDHAHAVAFYCVDKLEQQDVGGRRRRGKENGGGNSCIFKNKGTSSGTLS